MSPLSNQLQLYSTRTPFQQRYFSACSRIHRSTSHINHCQIAPRDIRLVLVKKVERGLPGGTSDHPESQVAASLHPLSTARRPGVVAGNRRKCQFTPRTSRLLLTKVIICALLQSRFVRCSPAAGSRRHLLQLHHQLMSVTDSAG